MKIARYVARARPAGRRPRSRRSRRARRLAHQIPDAEKAAQADYVLDNSGDMAALRAQVEGLWPRLKAESNKSSQNLSLK